MGRSTLSRPSELRALKELLTTEVAHGLQGLSVRGGGEYAFGRFELRAGARYSRDRWHPSAGTGFNLTPRLGLDVAFFDTSANIERRRNMAMAVSFRFIQTSGGE